MTKKLIFTAILFCIFMPFSAKATQQASGVISMEFDLSHQTAGEEAEL